MKRPTDILQTTERGFRLTLDGGESAPTRQQAIELGVRHVLSTGTYPLTVTTSAITWHLKEGYNARSRKYIAVIYSGGERWVMTVSLIHNRRGDKQAELRAFGPLEVECNRPTVAHGKVPDSVIKQAERLLTITKPSATEARLDLLFED